MNVKRNNYDKGIDSYIRKLLETEINENEITLYVELFSKYLGYTNSDYKYNVTYLNQYTNEFIKSCADLKYKNAIYNSIYAMLICKIGRPFELLIDNSYYACYGGLEYWRENRTNYIGYDTNKIKNDKFEIKFEIEHENKSYVFYKKYGGENINFLADDITLFLQEKGVLEKDK